MIGLALLLIFMPKNKSTTQEQDKDSQVSLNVYLPNTITLFIGTKAKIDNDAIVVMPGNKRNEITTEIIVKDMGVENGITFNDLILTANVVGEYQIKFSLKKDDSTTLAKIININVKDDAESQLIKQLKTTTNIGNTLNLTDAFFGFQNKIYTVEADDKISINDNVISPLKAGISNLTFTIKDSTTTTGLNVAYIYDFNLTIKPQPQYVINLLNVENNCIEIDISENNKCVFAYEVVDKSGNLTSQNVDCQSSDETLATIECPTDGILRVVAREVGEVLITIVSVVDENTKIEIKVIVT